MNSAFSYQNDLTRSGQEMEALMSERSEHIKAMQAPGLLEKSKALQKRGQDVLKSAQDLQSAIEMGVGAPAGAAIGKQITNPAIKALADSKPGKFVSGKIDELGEKVKGVVKDVGKRAGKEAVSVGKRVGNEAVNVGKRVGNEAVNVAKNVAKKGAGWIKQAGSEARQGVSDFVKKGMANNAGVGEQGEGPVRTSINDSGEVRSESKQQFGDEDFAQNAPGEKSTAPRSQEDMEERGRGEEEDEAGERMRDIFNDGESKIGELDGPGASNLVKGDVGGVGSGGAADDPAEEAVEDVGKGAKSVVKNVLGDVGDTAIEGTVDATVGSVAAADAWNPIGWILGIGLAVGSIVEGVNAAGDTAAANQQQHLADAVHLPKSPPINFAGKIVVPVESAIGQE